MNKDNYIVCISNYESKNIITSNINLTIKHKLAINVV